MRVAILNRVSLSAAPYDRWLKENGNELLLFTNMEKWNANKESDSAENFYSILEKIENYDKGGLLEARILYHSKLKPIDRIIAIAEIDQIRAARLRKKLGIPGQSVQSAIAFRDKFVMKNLAKKAGIPIPNFTSVDNALDLVQFIEANGYPIVVKPRYGAGSVNTEIINSENDLSNYLTKGLSPILELRPNLIAEAFVTGEMYHVDGIVKGGQIVLSWPSKYINGCLAFQSSQYLGSFMLGPQNPLVKRLLEFTENLLKALGPPENCTFHAEIFHTPNDGLVLCEVAARTGGAKVADAIQTSFGVHPTEIWIKLECKIDVKAEFAREPKIQSGWLLMPPKAKKLVRLPEKCLLPGIQSYNCTSKVGEVFEIGKTSVDQVSSFLITGESEHQVRERIQATAQWFDDHVIWE